MIRIRTNILTLMAAVALLALATVASAQTALNSTSLGAAISTREQQSIVLASTTSVNVGDFLAIDAEELEVTAIPVSGTISAKRGVQGTQARTHPNGAMVWTGPKKAFSMVNPSGSCTATLETYLPRIVFPAGNYYDCKGSEWVLLRREGYRATVAGRTDGATTYTALGAITIQPGISFINGTTLAMTLADPTLEQNGMVMYIISTNASAHTVTYTAGFGGGTTARDVATFGGAINDELVIIAFNKVWWVVSTRNVTLG